MTTIEQLHLPWPAWVWVETYLGNKYVDRTGVTHRIGGLRNIIETWQGGILKQYRPHPAEREALANLEYEAILWRQSGGRMELSEIHVKTVQAERAVKQHYPHIKGGEMMRWVAASAGLFRKNGRSKEPDVLTASSHLEHASTIMALREHLGLATALGEMTGRELKRLPMVA